MKKKTEPINPFTATLDIKAIKLVSTRELFDSDEYKTEDGIKLPVGNSVNKHEYQFSYLIEQQQAGKLYRGEVTEEVLKKLSDRASKLLLHIISSIPKDSDLISIDIDTYKVDYDIDSSQTVYNAITDLIKIGVIARFKPNRYWINPAIIFNGNRLKKYKDKVEVGFIKPLKEKKD